MKLYDAIRLENKIGIERHAWTEEYSLVILDDGFYYRNDVSNSDPSNRYSFTEGELLADDWIPVVGITPTTTPREKE